MGPVEVLVVVAALAVIGGVVAYGVISSQRADQARRDGATARGWTYRAGSGSNLWELEGDADGVPWRVFTPRPRGKGGSRGTTFELPAEGVPGAVLVGPKLPEALLQGVDLGHPLVQRALTAMLGADAADLASAKVVDREMLRATHTVLATDPALADAVLTPSAQVAILECHGRLGQAPIVLRWRHQVVVRTQSPLATIEAIDALVALGSRIGSEG